MPKNFAYPLGMLITIILGTLLYFNFCSKCQITNTSGVVEPTTVSESATTISLPEPTAFPFKIDGLGIDAADNFNFQIDSLHFITPVSNTVSSNTEQLASHLNNNPNKTIDITGFYTADENNISGFENLGQARANAVKNYFISKGIPASQTNIAGELKPEMIASEGVFNGPIGLKLGEKDNNAEEKLNAFHNDLKENPIVLYFDTGQASINLTESQRLKFTQLVDYLDKVNTSVCKVVGHSDNTGSKGRNYVLAQQRADFVKEFLVDNGIQVSRIDAISFGQDAPMVPNTTEENRAKNRRTVITLK